MSQAASYTQLVRAFAEIASVDFVRSHIFHQFKSSAPHLIPQFEGVEEQLKRFARGGYALRQRIEGHALQEAERSPIHRVIKHHTARRSRRGDQVERR